TLSDVDAGFAFGRLVAEAGYDVQDAALVTEEDEENRHPYSVILGVQPGEQETEKTRALQEAYQSPEVQEWFANNLEGSVEYHGNVTIDDAQETWQDFLAE